MSGTLCAACLKFYSLRWQNITNISPFFSLTLTYPHLLAVALLFHKWEEEQEHKLSTVCHALLVTNVNNCCIHFKFALTDVRDFKLHTVSMLLFFGRYGRSEERLHGRLRTLSGLTMAIYWQFELTLFDQRLKRKGSSIRFCTMLSLSRVQ